MSPNAGSSTTALPQAIMSFVVRRIVAASAIVIAASCGGSPAVVRTPQPGIYRVHETFKVIPKSGTPRDGARDVDVTIGQGVKVGDTIRQDITTIEDDGTPRLSTWTWTAHDATISQSRETTLNVSWRYDPPLESYKFPLKPGQQWSTRTSSTLDHPNGSRSPVTVRQTTTAGSISVVRRDSDTIAGKTVDVVELHSDQTTDVVELDARGAQIGHATVHIVADQKIDPDRLRATSYSVSTDSTGTGSADAFNYSETRRGQALTTSPTV
jgi:hypothetical protein